MSNWLSRREMKRVRPAERITFESPVPTQIVSTGEFTPPPQTLAQKRVEARIAELADAGAAVHGLSRREFMQTSSGMAVAFLAMNDVFGGLFGVGRAEAADLDAAAERAAGLAGQLIFDNQTHFSRDDHEEAIMLETAKFAKKHWNPEIFGGAKIDFWQFKFENYLKEMYVDSDTKVAMLSSVPFDDTPWLLSNPHMAGAREIVNELAGSRRMLCHAVIRPGHDGWLDQVDEAIASRPDSWKGYTIGDPLQPSKLPWRLDDEKTVYPFYEKISKAGINTVCIHKGLITRDYEAAFPDVWKHATVDDVGKAARDWPGLNFVIYHSALRPFIEVPDVDAAEFEKTGYIQWVSDLARIPEKFGVNNVYGEIGTSFANTVVTHPRLTAGMLGTLIAGLGIERVLWGTDSTWYGSPQWQIEAFRRLEIPDDLQAKHGFAPLGDATGPVKSAILWNNSAKLYGLDSHASAGTIGGDAIDSIRAEYRAHGIGRSNRAYGYVSVG